MISLKGPPKAFEMPSVRIENEYASIEPIESGKFMNDKPNEWIKVAIVAVTGGWYNGKVFFVSVQWPADNRLQPGYGDAAGVQSQHARPSVCLSYAWDGATDPWEAHCLGARSSMTRNPRAMIF